MKSTKRKPLKFAPRPNPREEEREQRQTDFLRYIAQGESIEDACALVGVTRFAYEKWRNRHQESSKAVAATRQSDPKPARKLGLVSAVFDVLAAPSSRLKTRTIRTIPRNPKSTKAACKISGIRPQSRLFARATIFRKPGHPQRSIPLAGPLNPSPSPVQSIPNGKLSAAVYLTDCSHHSAAFQTRPPSRLPQRGPMRTFAITANAQLFDVCVSPFSAKG